MNYIDWECWPWVLLEDGKNVILHTRGMVTFPAASVFEALRLAKCSSALVMLSEEITVPHLETSKVKHSRGIGKLDHILLHGGSLG